jgi:hypothetical protein
VYVSKIVHDKDGTATGGTTLDLEFTCADRLLVEVEGDRCRVTTFEDDKHMNLREGASNQQESTFTMTPNPTADSEDAPSHIRTVCGGYARLPSKDATSLQLKAEVAFLCADKVSRARQEGLKLEKGATITNGPARLTVTKAERERGGITIWLETKADSQEALDRVSETVREIRFLDAEGKTIDCDKVDVDGASDTGDDESHTVAMSWGYHLPTDAGTVTVEVEYIEGVSHITVPVEVTANLGLNQARKKVTAYPSNVPVEKPDESSMRIENVKAASQPAGNPANL